MGQNKTVDSLKLVLKKSIHDTTRCNILNELIEIENDDAIWPLYNDQLKSIAEINLKKISSSKPEHKIFNKHLANALNNIGYLANIKGDTQTALDYYKKSLKIQEEIGDKRGIANSLNNMAAFYQNQGEITKALEYHQRSLKIRESIDDKQGIASSLNNIGVIYETQSNIPKALEYYSRGLKNQEIIGDKRGMATSLLNIGSIYRNLREIRKALVYYHKSLKIAEEFGDKKEIAEQFNSIGAIYYDQGNIIEAFNYFIKSLKTREETGDKYGIARSLSNIGAVYYNHGDPSVKSSKANAIKAGIAKALECHRKSLILQEEIGDKNGIAGSLYNIGLIHLYKKNYPKALEFANRSMFLSKELGYPQYIGNAANLLSQIYKAMGNYKFALENYEIFTKIHDSIDNEISRKASIKQQLKHEFETKAAADSVAHAKEFEIKNAEIAIHQAEIKAKKNQQNALYGGIALVTLFAGFMFNRYKVTQKQKKLIEAKEKETQMQKEIIEEKQKEILDSINYAKRIQYTLLAHDEFLKNNLKEYFAFYKPKDIVSGDFYWASKLNNKFYLAVCDSTGHGVPGAFMSLLNIGFLTEAINEKGIEKPNEVFDYVRLKLTNTVSKDGQKDGFDGVLICFEYKLNINGNIESLKKITYASANNAPVLVKSCKVPEIFHAPYDRMPVGVGERKENFCLYTIDANPGDMLYFYTDGYADQFGGTKGKKFKYKQLDELLCLIHMQPMEEQKMALQLAFENWKGKMEQVDDVCVIGIRI